MTAALPQDLFRKAGFSKFRVEARHTDNGEEWALLQPLQWRDPILQELLGVHFIVIPTGFISDLSSIPWLAEPIFFDVDTRPAGAAHDFLYGMQMDRAIADAIYRQMLLRLGANPAQAWAAYTGLRMGGWLAYSNYAYGMTLHYDFAPELMTDPEKVEVVNFLDYRSQSLYTGQADPKHVPQFILQRAAA